MELEAKERQKLEELISLLESIKGRHTELVTVLIPVGTNIFTVTRQLEAEKSTSENIKSKQTRTVVTSAIEAIIRELKNYRQTPPNGLALYAGNISKNEGTQDIKVWACEPPKPLNVRMYRCDKTFVLEPLKEMLEAEEIYGLLVIDRQQAMIGLLEGKRIMVISKHTSGVPGKIKAGGQSSARFARITEGLAKEFYRRIADDMKKAFFDMPKLKGILVGGPMPTKEAFLEEGDLVTKLKEKVIAIKDLGYVDEHGLELLVEDSQQEISQQELIKEKNIVLRFFSTLGKTPEKAAYGFERVKLALERGAVDTLLISKKLLPEETIEFEQAAEKIGAEVAIISTEHQDGEQFYNLTKGIAAVLRFALE